jgi:hypothetical protein
LIEHVKFLNRHEAEAAADKFYAELPKRTLELRERRRSMSSTSPLKPARHPALSATDGASPLSSAAGF